MKKKKKTKIRRGRNKQTNKQKTATITVYYIIIITILLMITIWLLWLLLLLLLIWCQHSFTLTIIISSWVSIFLFFPPTRSEGRADHMCSDANASVDNNNWNRNVTIAIDCRTATVICLIVWFCFYFFFLSFFLSSFLPSPFLLVLLVLFVDFCFGFSGARRVLSVSFDQPIISWYLKCRSQGDMERKRGKRSEN